LAYTVIHPRPPRLFSRAYRSRYKVKAWPALVDERDSVAIKLFDNPLEQKQAMWNGLRRLLLLNIPSPIK
ncbi:DUF3418 domain-containing protein, partial [Escherichia coli]|uniref:DUF3418 domain-containing protein n=1 Tax=Escherichia coli TaxID=562 RepID=UPI003F50469D